MTDTMLDRTENLRDEAYAVLEESEAFRAFKALDDAVAAMGGRRLLAAHGGVTFGGVPLRTARVMAELRRQRRRISQGDAAEMVLKERGRPMTAVELLDAVPEKGVEVGGEKRLMSFGSTLSRDRRFVSYRRDGLYYWWLKARPMPPGNNEAPDLPSQVGSDASSSASGQEGGDANAAST